MVQCENGSVLHLQFWFVCKSKSRTLFLTLPSGSIQECSRFINKSGFIMIWSILAHWSFNQSNCLYRYQTGINLKNLKAWKFWKKYLYNSRTSTPSRVVYYSLSIAICTSSCVSSIERRLDKSKKSLSFAWYLKICDRLEYWPAVHSPK